MNLALSLLVAIVMIVGGSAHLLTPATFTPLVPPFLPAVPMLIATGIVQIGIGLAALWPQTRRWAGLAFAVLCLGYLPLHLWDFVRPDPVFAPPLAAAVRVAIQLLFILAGVTLYRRSPHR